MNRGVCLRIECALPARLVQQAAEAGAILTSVRVSGRLLTICCDPRSVNILTEICRSHHLNLRILRRSGNSALIDALRRRWTLLPALLLSAGVCAFALTRFWLVQVDFPVADVGDPQPILRCIEASGFKTGIPRGEIDLDALCKRISAEAGDFSHVSAKADGVILRIEAVPETPAPEIFDARLARDLVAARAGIVQSVFVRSGEACVSVGDTVAPGWLLIRGDERGSGKDRAPISALGQVFASVWFEGTASAPLRQTRQIPTGRTRTESVLRVMGVSVPLSECAPFDAESIETEVLPVIGLFLPVEIHRTTHRELSVKTETEDAEALKDRLRALARGEAIRKLGSEIKTYEIASEWSDAEILYDEMRVRAVIEAIADIAAPR